MDLFTKKVSLPSISDTAKKVDLIVCLIADNDYFYVVMALEINEMEVATTSEKFTSYLTALDRYIESA